MNDGLPLVSAIMVTGKIPFVGDRLTPVAIGSFNRQTYPNKELVLVTDDHVAYKVYGEICRNVVPVFATGTLGDLRNAGLDAARGPLAIQFDSDDWHHPDRIQVQVDAFLEHDGNPVFLKRQLCYSFTTDTAFVREIEDNWIHGTILHRNRPCFRYPSMCATEDTEFLKQWKAHTVLNNDPRLYVRFAHQNNTTAEIDIMGGRPKNLWDVTDEQGDYLREVLENYPNPTAPPASSSYPASCD